MLCVAGLWRVGFLGVVIVAEESWWETCSHLGRKESGVHAVPFLNSVSFYLNFFVFRLYQATIYFLYWSITAWQYCVSLCSTTMWISFLLLFSCRVASSSFATSWTIACQAPLSMGFPRQELWSGLPFPSPRESSWSQGLNCVFCVSCISSRFFTTELPGKPESGVSMATHSSILTWNSRSILTSS